MKRDSGARSRAQSCRSLLVLVLAFGCGNDDKTEAFIRDCMVVVRSQCTVDVCLGNVKGLAATDGGPVPDPFDSPSEGLIDACVAYSLSLNGDCRPESAAMTCGGGKPVYVTSETCERNAHRPVCSDLCQRTAEGTFCFPGCGLYCIH